MLLAEARVHANWWPHYPKATSRDLKRSFVHQDPLMFCKIEEMLSETRKTFIFSKPFSFCCMEQAKLISKIWFEFWSMLIFFAKVSFSNIISNKNILSSHFVRRITFKKSWVWIPTVYKVDGLFTTIICC